VAGETSPVLRRAKSAVADEGSYVATARNGAGSTTTAAAVVRVKVPFVTRTLPVGYWPGVKFVVRLRSEPRAETQSHEISETVPEGWTVLAVSTGGQVEPDGKKVRFGPFGDAQARDLSYTLQAPAGLVNQTIGFAGSAVADGLTTTVRGPVSVGRGPYHPADLAGRDGKIGIGEVTQYASAWKRAQTWTEGPVPIPIGYVTRAGSLWRQGEAYEFDPENGAAPRWWVVPTSRVRPADLTSSTPIRARRGIQSLGGDRWRITVAVDPGLGALTQALEESVPAGVRVARIPDGATLQEGVVRWGPFFDDQAREFAYEVESPRRPDAGEGHLGVDGWVIRVVPAERTEPNSLRLGFQGRMLWLEGPSAAGRRLESSPDLRHWVPAGMLPDSDQPIGLDLPNSGDHLQFFRVVVPTPAN
jgi:hypothetical protein